VHDEYRVQIESESPGEVLSALKAVQITGEAHRELPRLAITHEGHHVFMYADSANAAKHAREVAQQAMAEHGVAGEAAVMRWHQLEDRWEDASAPLPATPEARAAEHERLEELQNEESLQAHHAEWEVRVSLPTHHNARTFAERLRSEGIPVKQLWRHLLIGANDEDDAVALSRRVRAEAPEGSEITAEGNGLDYWQMLHPYAYLGGLGN
jgi:hypothetical protein